MRRRPDERWMAVQAAIAEPSHPIEAACWRHVNQVEMSPSIDRALEIYLEQFERERLQPWILAGATDLDIEERVGLPRDTVRAYQHLFFNVGMFRDMLDKQLWVARYDGTAEGMAFLQKAVLEGLESVAHVMGAQVKIDPAAMMENAARDLYFRGQAIKYARVASADAAAAHSMLKSAVEFAREQTKSRPPNITDVMMRLKNRDMTQRVEDVAPHEEILH